MELKNDISIKGTLKSVDQYLNIKLDDIGVLEEVRYPHMVSWQLCGVLLAGLRDKNVLTVCEMLVFRQERVHKRERGALRPSTGCRCRYCASGRCDEER